MESSFDSYSLIVKYLKKEINDKDLFSLNEWLKADVKNLNEFHEIKDSWIFSNSSDDNEVEEALERFNKKVEPSIKITKKQNGHWFYKVASIALLLISSFFIYLYLNSNYKDNQPTVSTSQMNTVEIPIGEKGQVTLSDGTKVWLNSGSKLTYPPLFTESREVTFEGEAYFDVATNKQIPFYVRTADITVKVTGTEFNIKSYPEEETVTTTLIEGIVEILDNDKGVSQVSLKPNEVATFNKEKRSFVLEEIKKEQALSGQKINTKKIHEITPSVESITSWKENHLVFENETLQEMVKKMERWFGVNFILNMEESNERYSGKFVYNESIEQVLYVLSRTTPIKYKIEKNNVTINPK